MFLILLICACRLWRNFIPCRRFVVLIQIIMIYAFLVLGGIAFSITEDFDNINELLSGATDLIYHFVFSDVLELSKTFPAVDMVFSNGQKLSLSPENYLFRVSNGLVYVLLKYFLTEWMLFRSSLLFLPLVIFLYTDYSFFWFMWHQFYEALKGTWCILPGGFSEWKGSNHTFRRYIML